MNDLNRKLHEARGLCWHEKNVLEPNTCYKCGDVFRIPHIRPAYDTDLVAAFELVDEMREKGAHVSIYSNRTTWFVEVRKSLFAYESDESLPRAISLACAKALGTTEED